MKYIEYVIKIMENAFSMKDLFKGQFSQILSLQLCNS